MTEPITIELITTPGCTTCAAVRATIQNVLSEFDAEFVTIDLTEQPAYAREYQLLSAPAVIINGQREFQGQVSADRLHQRLTEIQS